MFGRGVDTGFGVRIGLVYEHRVLEERVVEPPSPVSVGRAVREATVSADVPRLPDKLTLIDWREGRYVLRCFPEMNGKISDGEKIRTLEEMRSEVETDDSGAALIPLRGTFSAGIEAGDAVVLVQRVDARVRSRRPALPRELRGGWLGSLDRRLSLTLAAVAALQIGFVAWTQWNDWPQPAELNRMVYEDVFVAKKEWPQTEQKSDAPEPKPATPRGEEEEAPESKGDAPEGVAEKSEPPTDKQNSEPSPEPAGDRNVGENVERGTVLEALGSKGGQDLVAQMETASPEGEMDEAIANSRRDRDTDERSLETAGSGSSGSSGTAVGYGNLGRTSGARTAESGRATGEYRDDPVNCAGCDDNIIVDPEGPQHPDPQGIGDVIENNKGRIEQCYARYLKRDGSLAGKIIIAFKVGATGEAIAVHPQVDTVGSGVGACIVGVLRSLDFPATKGQAVQFEKTFVFEPSR